MTITEPTRQPSPCIQISGEGESHCRQEFLHRLESLRGLAALMVAGQHSFAVLLPTGWQSTAHQFIWVICNGHAAVTLFFVLSGLVLGLSLARSRGHFALTYGTFAVRRVFRIWPAHLVACLVIAAAILCFDRPMSYPPEVSPWFQAHWRETITGGYLLRNMLFRDFRLNVPTWTLRAELVCSLALPIIFFLHRRASSLLRVGLLGVLIGASLLVGGNLSAWSFMFYLGLLVPAIGPQVMTWVARGPAAAGWITVMAALVLCGGIQVYGSYPRWGNIAEATAAATLIATILYAPELSWARVLDWPITRFYGRISFSFYLYHMVCLYFVSKTALRLCPAALMTRYFIVSASVLLLVSMAIATLLASISRRLVEMPGIELSKRLCRMTEREGVLGSLFSTASVSSRTHESTG